MGRLWGLFRQPPRLVFHLAVVPPALLLLYALSFPGVSFLPLMAAGALLLVASTLWTVRVVTYAVALARGRSSGSPAWLVVAPLGGLLVSALAYGEVPLRARWAVSKPAFERVAAGSGEAASTRLGWYEITGWSREGDAVVFVEKTGSFFDDAGFAYLPHGPSAGLEHEQMEDPSFRPLGDGWYAWTGGW